MANKDNLALKFAKNMKGDLPMAEKLVKAQKMVDAIKKPKGGEK
jgi:hypothetical protein